MDSDGQPSPADDAPQPSGEGGWPGEGGRADEGGWPGDVGRRAAVVLASVCGVAIVALVVVAAVVPPPDRLARGLLVVVAVVLLAGVATGWFRTVRLMAERQR